MRTLVALAMTLVISGCASRSMVPEDHPMKEISNLYNRNAVVAAPTYVGNVVCGTPFLIAAFGIDAIYPGKRPKWWGEFLDDFYLVPAMTCGAILGTPFIPFSYLCDETPWEFDFKFAKNHRYECVRSAARTD